MRRNHFNFNPHRYETHLSPFGRKVLNVLIAQWNNEQERRSDVAAPRQRHCPTRHNRIITFKDSSVVDILASCDRTPDNNDEDAPFHCNIDLPEPPPAATATHYPAYPVVPRSGALLKTMHTHNDSNDPTFSLVNTAVTMDSSAEIRNYQWHEKRCEETNSKSIEPVNRAVAHEAKTNMRECRDVNWDDMFDTELFSEIDSGANAVTDNVHNSTAKRFEVHLPNERKASKPDEENPPELLKRITNAKARGANSKKVPKRKNQLKTDVVPTKVKKLGIECSKTLVATNYRKQKYTKTVKNWLNDIDSSNTNEDDAPIPELNNSKTESAIEPNKPETATKRTAKQKSNTCKNKKAAITIEKPPKEVAKRKVIQSQLANKDGVMKFGKPNKNKNNNEVNLEACETTAAEKENLIKEKTKAKFIAPIKSQIPVQDITYEVIVVDKANLEEQRTSLSKVESCEVILVLIYSNGFCQLNSHHTDDTCTSEGILVNTTNDDMFYYFKGSDADYRDVLTRTITANNIICYEGKDVLIYLRSKFDIEFCDPLNITDVKIGGSILDADKPPGDFSELQKLLSFTPQYTVATECALQRAAWYATLLAGSARSLTELLHKEGLWNVFVNIEMPLLPIIADMEAQGVCVDVEKLKSMESALLVRLRAVEAACYAAAGRHFQLHSAAQVRALLYDELRLDEQSNLTVRETLAKGDKSTSEAVLRSLGSAHPLPKLLLEYRHLHKAHSTFLAGIAQHVKDGVIRPTWVQNAAATGRIACANPNLQAIPKAPFSMHMFPEADDEHAGVSLCLRRVYVCPSRRVLVAADFRQVECRLLAHAADDHALRNALAAEDMFTELAAQWLRCAPGAVSPGERERTKRAVYATVYGAGARNMAAAMDTTYEHALALMASFNGSFPSLRAFCRSAAARCAQAGGRARTPAGRARTLRDIHSAGHARRAHAERQAVNFIVQGAAADLCKSAMVACVTRLRGSGARLVLQIHDELVWEVPEDRLKELAVIIKDAMESCGALCGLPAPLPVALSCGRSWGDMTPYDPQQDPNDPQQDPNDPQQDPSDPQQVPNDPQKDPCPIDNKLP